MTWLALIVPLVIGFGIGFIYKIESYHNLLDNFNSLKKDYYNLCLANSRLREHESELQSILNKKGIPNIKTHVL